MNFDTCNHRVEPIKRCSKNDIANIFEINWRVSEIKFASKKTWKFSRNEKNGSLKALNQHKKLNVLIKEQHKSGVFKKSEINEWKKKDKKKKNEMKMELSSDLMTDKKGI